MPSTGGTSFLPWQYSWPDVVRWLLCQCPQRAGPHFYWKRVHTRPPLSWDVSMPSTGGTSFLPCVRKQLQENIRIVSMPSTGGTSFLHEYGDDDEDEEEDVSMPSTGGTSFLHQKKGGMYNEKKCVNALNGRDLISTFYNPETDTFSVAVCQCPQRAGPHFYQHNNCWRKVSFWCQCPQRAGPHFYLLS